MKQNSFLKKLIFATTLFLSCFTIVKAEENIAEIEIPITCETDCIVKIEAIEPTTSPLPSATEIKIDSSKTSSFLISYKEVGNYNYKIYQPRTVSSDIDLDKTVYTVEVAINYGDDGKLAKSIIVKNASTGEKPDRILFRNKKSPVPTPSPTVSPTPTPAIQSTSTGFREAPTGAEETNSIRTGIVFIGIGIILLIVAIKFSKADQKKL